MACLWIQGFAGVAFPVRGPTCGRAPQASAAGRPLPEFAEVGQFVSSPVEDHESHDGSVAAIWRSLIMRE